MKQPDDLATLELPGLQDATVKRGRGRPRKDDALTPAQRAKRYRDRKKAAKRTSRMPWQGPNGETWTGRGLMPAWLRVLSPEARDKCDHRQSNPVPVAGYAVWKLPHRGT